MLVVGGDVEAPLELRGGGLHTLRLRLRAHVTSANDNKHNINKQNIFNVIKVPKELF